MEPQALNIVRESLDRCVANPVFLDRFYDTFLSSSPKVKAKFAQTNFNRQKRALQGSLHGMLSFASSPDGSPDDYLRDVADRHSRAQLDIGAELYDLWLDSLLVAVRECDPQNDDRVQRAWEETMMVGIRYFLSRY